MPTPAPTYLFYLLPTSLDSATFLPPGKLVWPLETLMQCARYNS